MVKHLRDEGAKVTQIACGSRHTVVLTERGKVWETSYTPKRELCLSTLLGLRDLCRNEYERYEWMGYSGEQVQYSDPEWLAQNIPHLNSVDREACRFNVTLT